MRPLFSVIIPTYNRAVQLRRSLDSVNAQTFREFEVIVCDDGSTDHTRDVVVSYQERLAITYHREDNWGGPARPRNTGIQAAKGEWICFLDADDWWYPDKLELVRGVLSHADVVYHDGDVFSSTGDLPLARMRSRALGAPAFVDMMTKGNPFITSGICVRREVLARTGGFLEDKVLISVEDYDLWLKIAMITDRFVHIPRPLCGYWKGEGNISGTTGHITALRALFDMHKDRLPPNLQRESEKYFSYCIGLSMLENRIYREGRRQFRLSLTSRNVRLSAMSLIRILQSFMREVSGSSSKPSRSSP